MKFKFLMVVIGTILLGIICADYVFKQYAKDDYTFSDTNNIYYLQCGVYTDIESIEETKYKTVTVLEDNKYYVYLGMTTKLDNAKKIKEKYEDNNLDIYIKEGYTSNSEFISNLEQYDILLDSADTKDEINNILETILASYEEIYMSD